MDIKGYKLIKKEELKDIGSVGYYFKHEKTQAKVAVILNDDDNKVFNIAFRTPVSDSTGVPHITEHSVLCGSKKFPLKDPFVELIKGSLNTFLNAMTYDDKTCYPVASTNDKDFHNLMDVYLDAVFNPKTYEREEIFEQEGWSLRLESKDAPLEYNGVVYSEMKGALSDPDSYVRDEIMKNLYPDTNYGFESGGIPEEITKLTYEDFLDFHRRYYHPSNSFIYLYGDLDMEKELKWIDEEYLSSYDYLYVDSEIHMQKPFNEAMDITINYPIATDETEEDKTILTYSVVFGDVKNVHEYYASSQIDYALCNAEGAMLKQRLLDAGIGTDISCYSDYVRRQPVFTIEVTDSNPDKKEEFVKIIEDTLKEISDHGFDKDLLESNIELMEFRKREADYNNAPKGLIYGLNMLNTWLYYEDMPFDIFKYTEEFAFLRNNIYSGFYEGFVDKYILSNPHKVILTAVPVKGLTAKKDEELAKKLEVMKKNMTDEELEEIIQKTKALKKYQETPDSEENLRSLPLLEISDIEREQKLIPSEIREENGVKILFHEMNTNKIAYADLVFNADFVKDEDIKYLALLEDLLGLTDTKYRSYKDLNTEIYRLSGGVSGRNMQYLDKDGKTHLVYGIKTKVLYKNIGKIFNILNEILLHEKFEDKKRIRDLLGNIKASKEADIVSSYDAATTRAGSYFSMFSAVREQMGGLTYYRFICDLFDNFDKLADETISKINELYEKLTDKNTAMVNITCDREGYDKVVQNLDILTKGITAKDNCEAKREFSLERKNEGITTSSMVQYDVMAGNFKDAGFKYDGRLKVLSQLMRYEYLWQNVRVKGGAYGCGLTASITGNMSMYSYRDPNIKSTYEIYKNIVSYLRTLELDERELKKIIIGTISAVDSPMTPATKNGFALSDYFYGVTDEERQKWREDVLDITLDGLRETADVVESVVKQNYICTVGSESKIAEDKDVFMNITGIK